MQGLNISRNCQSEFYRLTFIYPSIDGPSHFIIKKDRSLTLSGTSLAKQRVMAKCGQFDRIF